MPRLRRFCIAGVPQHIIHRGNNRQPLFFSDADYTLYLDVLAGAATKHGCAIHAYVLMTNHVHLLMTPLREDALPVTMRDAGRRYVQQHVNARYRRTGSLFEGRYKSILVDAQSYFFACCRYVELNPVRAGTVAQPEDYRWSSYRYHAWGLADPYLTPHEEYTGLATTIAGRCAAYRGLFRAHGEGELEEMRNAVTRGWPVGGDCFRASVHAALASHASR
jgi:putative transposase